MVMKQLGWWQCVGNGNCSSTSSVHGHDNKWALLMHTWATNAILVQYIVLPDWFPCLCIHHGTHHLVKCLVSIALQVHLLIPVHEASAKT